MGESVTGPARLQHWLCKRGGQRDGQPISLATPKSHTASCSTLKYQRASFDLIYEDVDMQPNGIDCGLYSLAFATTLCSGGDPVKLHYHNDQMRSHLMKCLENGVVEPFPATKCGARHPRSIQTVEVYCHCRMPDGNSKMIQCLACREWFHQHC